MKNPATCKLQPTLILDADRLDADPQPSRFSYSTLQRPFGGEKGQAVSKAGGTGAFRQLLSRRVKINA
jgi:hypothetical protein